MPRIAEIDYVQRYAGTPIKICSNDVVGRYMVSSRDIKRGEVVLESNPQVFISSEEHEARVCDNCFHTNEGQSLTISCIHCRRVHYCSIVCRDDATARHSRECAVFSGLDWSKYDEYTKDIVRLFVRTLASRDTACERTSEQISMILELAANAECFPQDQQDMLAGLLDDVEKLATQCLSSGRKMFSLPSREELVGIYCREYINSFGLWRSSGQGLGVYVISSLINHSCAPNIIRFEDGPTVVFRAAHDIEAGAELTIAYIPIEDGLCVRRCWLDEGFHFHCMCRRCKADDEAIMNGKPLDDSMISYLTSDDCPLGCGGTLERLPKPYETENKFCNGCGVEKVRAALFTRPN